MDKARIFPCQGRGCPGQPGLLAEFTKKYLCAGIAQLARARPCQGRGCEFESRYSLIILNKKRGSDYISDFCHIKNFIQQSWT